ncbi:MAG: hypothetical protein WC781_01190 [Candidatus Pacearchaeota archaeon]|jgi:hypothetical protein
MSVYNSIYGGRYYSLDDNYKAPMGYEQRTSGLGLAIDPRTANQLQEVSNKLNIGGKHIEVQGTFANILEAIPDEHLKEIKKVSELTGSKLSFHGPLLEPSGFNQQGGKWDESNRQQIERQLTNAVERSHMLDPKGNIVVTLHSSAQLPEMLQRERVKTPDGKYEEKVTGMYIVDPRTGKVDMLKETERYFEENIQGKKYKFDVNVELEKRNRETWDNTLNQFAYYADRASEALESPKAPEEQINHLIKEGKLTEKEAMEQYPEVYNPEAGSMSEKRENFARIYLRNSYDQLKDLYDMAYRSAKDDGRQGDLDKLDKFAREISKDYDKLKNYDLETMNKVVQEGVKVLEDIKQTSIFQPFNNFVIDKSAQTFANVATSAYEKFIDNAPIISIENPPAGSGISRAEDMKILIDKSREKLVENLSKKGVSEGEAKKIAEKMIGATWDVGHINMLRKFGYEKEQLVKQAETIAPYVKHVHLSDNFGYEHTELPMGMGNVPLKEELAKFGDKLNKIQKVVETGDWWQHFKTPPMMETFSAFGSPIYSSGASQYWNRAASTYGSYFAGYGTTLPEQHFSMYGGGFSGLPTELGGQQQTRGSRATGGTPMA